MYTVDVSHHHPDRPLVKPANIAGAPITVLLKPKLPEYRSRYRTRHELRGRDADEVTADRQTDSSLETSTSPQIFGSVGASTA